MNEQAAAGTKRRFTEQEAEAILRRVEYWHYPFELPWGTTTPAKRRHGDRHQLRRDHFIAPLVESYGGSLAGKRVLDLGCCQGYWTFEAARAGASFAVGLDSAPAFVEEATALRTILDVPDTEFRHAHLEDDPWWETMEPVDICFCLGLFYHLTDPIAVLRRAMALTRETIVMDTQIWTAGWPRDAAAPPAAAPAMLLVNRNPDEPTTTASGLSSSLRTLLTKPALVALFNDGGFSTIDHLSPASDMPREYLKGRRIAMIARRESGSFSG